VRNKFLKIAQLIFAGFGQPLIFTVGLFSFIVNALQKVYSIHTPTHSDVKGLRCQLANKKAVKQKVIRLLLWTQMDSNHRPFEYE